MGDAVGKFLLRRPDAVNLNLVVSSHLDKAFHGHLRVLSQVVLHFQAALLGLFPFIAQPVVPVDVFVLEQSPLLIQVVGHLVTRQFMLFQPHDVQLVVLHGGDDGFGSADGDSKALFLGFLVVVCGSLAL